MTLGRIALLACAALALLGCSSTMRIVVESTRTTNDGKTLYVIARKVGDETFVTEDYTKVAGLLYPRDESVLAAKSVFPGKPQELRFEAPEDADVTVYAFFTHPDAEGDTWRVALPRPLPSDVIVVLGDNRILRVLYRSR